MRGPQPTGAQTISGHCVHIRPIPLLIITLPLTGTAQDILGSTSDSGDTTVSDAGIMVDSEGAVFGASRDVMR